MGVLGLLTSGLFITYGQIYLLGSVFEQRQISGSFNHLDTSNIRDTNISQELAFEGTGKPPDRGSGGGRGPCEDGLITLVPGIGSLMSNGENCDGVSLSSSLSSINTFTLQENPTLWLYVSGSYPAGTTLTIQLIEGRTVVEAKDFTLPATAGVISVYLDHSLEVGITYTWTAEIKIFSGRGRSENPTGGGMVMQRAYSDEFMAAIETLPSADKSRYFLAHGLWYDALNEIAIARLSNPEDEALAEEWQNLLTAFGLRLISNQPLIDCCQSSD